MYKLCFYVPVSHLAPVKEAVFNAGAGIIGNYSHCAWEVLGEGQFMPLQGSEPFIGETDKLEKVPEYKVEMVCAQNCIHEVISALKEAHPYETPAYEVWKLENF
ncbi:Nif3-like dinuclear metal center hexameric protein [Legionella saoudiensis]|uniref:Nif3-like dinuclear metal center hexameric protein n=1 Tax=Legionella saoudiensis TaxID=1750561 RepID=UPI000730ADBF|nr:YqfO family protein [Legionella saoudiensis]